MPEYTIAAVSALVLVVLAELLWLRTGLFRSPSYWATMGISIFFMILVDGWLTKLSAPIVEYDDEMRSPWRFPWDVPVEDYPFGIALLTAVLLLWVRQDGRRQGEDDYRNGLSWRSNRATPPTETSTTERPPTERSPT